MALPQPDVALTDICSVVFNNTLYTYSSTAFQSLPLTSGAEWEKLDQGEAVTGATCVGSTPSDSSQAGFFVVGGKGSSTDYQGLQKYTYATGKWASITLDTPVTQDRLYHAATYLNDSDTIFMYAGSQDGSSGPSTQTFTIQASAPYGVISYSSTAPPTVSPILLQWSSSTALMIGGDVSNTKVMLFEPKAGWTDSNATLSTPITKNTGSIQASLATGDDGSKNLFTYDLSLSPNQVSRIVLVDGTGQANTNAAPVKRELTTSNWPAYNSSLASTTTRSGFSTAQGTDGMVVIAGGGGDDVLCVFDELSNSWRNATKMLTSQKTRLQTVSSSSTSATPTSTSISSTSSATVATNSAATSTAPAATTGSTLPTNIILAIVLSTVVGLGLLLVILYCLVLRHRKRRNHLEAAHNRRASGAPSSEKDAFAIANDFAHGSGKGTFRGYHQAQDSTGSLSSVAILMGRVNQPTSQQSTRDMSTNHAGNGYNKGLKSTISKPILQASAEKNLEAAAIPRQAQFERAEPNTFGASVAVPQTEPETQPQQRQDNTRRSSGWNRYWSGGSTLNIIGFGNGNGNSSSNNANNPATQRTTMTSDVSSTYSADQHRITQDSATVPPLNIPSVPDSKPRFQRVNSGSPTISSYDNFIKDSMHGKIERQASRESIHSAYSSGIPASVHDPWDPTASSDKPWGSSRAPSSAYSSGGFYSTPLAPATNNTNKRAYVPTGMSRQPQLAMANTSSDMSWLNLGDVSRIPSSSDRAERNINLAPT